MKQTAKINSKSNDRLENEIQRLEKKLNFKGKGTQRVFGQLEDDGLLDIFRITDKIGNEYKQHLELKGKKKVKETIVDTFQEENLENNLNQKSKNNQIIFEENKEIEFKDIDFVLKRKNPLKHIQNLISVFSNSNIESQEKIAKRLSKIYFSSNNEPKKLHILILLILKGFGEKNNFGVILHSMVQNFIEALKIEENNFLHLYFSFAYLFKIFNLNLANSFIFWLIEKKQFRNLGQIMTFIGSLLRKESPKLIANLSRELDAIENDSTDFRYAQTVIKKIKLNQVIKCTLPENFNKYKSAIKTFERRKKENESIFSASLTDLLKVDFTIKNWFTEFYKIEEKSQLSSKHAELIKKYEEAFRKLSIESINQKLIAAAIFESENYIQAAEKIFRLKVFHSNLYDIPKTIFSLIFAEHKFNVFYAYLTSQMTKLINDLEFSFYKYIWNFYKDLANNQIDKRKTLFLINFIVHVWKLEAFDFKLIKNFDFTSIHKNQKIFNRSLFKRILQEISSEWISKQIDKYLRGKNAEILADEVQTFSENYHDNYLEIDFGPDSNKEEILEKLDLFENIL